MSYCPECGEEVSEGQKYCDNCGTKLSDGNREDGDKEVSEDQDNSKSLSDFGLSIPRRKKIVLLLGIVLISGIAFVDMMGEEPLESSDLDISELNWQEVHMDDGSLNANGNLTLSTSENLNVRVYTDSGRIVSDPSPETPPIYPESIGPGEKELGQKKSSEVKLYDVPVESLSDAMKLEVCFSRERDFDRTSSSSVCKKNVFSPPEASLEVSENDIDFSMQIPETIGDNNVETSEIVVTNDGEIPVTIGQNIKGEPADGVYFTEEWTSVPERYGDYDMIGTMMLRPGETASFNVEAEVSAVAQSGTYTANGNVFAIWEGSNWENAAIKKEYDITAALWEGYQQGPSPVE